MGKNILVFASGTDQGGGSGFKRLRESVDEGILAANIIGVVSNHLNGGVAKVAADFNVPFTHFESPWTAERYQKIVSSYNPDFVALSGWLKIVHGLDPRTTFNIHPGSLPRFGGKGMYGKHIHEAVIKAFHDGEISHSAITMHFVTEKYDEGPVFFRYPIKIEETDTAETLRQRVNKEEHRWQPLITNKVIKGEIRWDGKNTESLVGGED